MLAASCQSYWLVGISITGLLGGYLRDTGLYLHIWRILARQREGQGHSTGCVMGEFVCYRGKTNTWGVEIVVILIQLKGNYETGMKVWGFVSKFCLELQSVWRGYEPIEKVRVCMTLIVLSEKRMPSSCSGGIWSWVSHSNGLEEARHGRPLQWRIWCGGCVHVLPPTLQYKHNLQ